jgi:predicted DNA-binding protein
MGSNKPKKDRPIGIRLPADVYDRLKARAEADQRTVSNYLLKLIKDHLDQ